MALYFLDHENIGSQGLKGIELLTKNKEEIINAFNGAATLAQLHNKLNRKGGD